MRRNERERERERERRERERERERERKNLEREGLCVYAVELVFTTQLGEKKTWSIRKTRDRWGLLLLYNCSDFRYESNGIFVLGVSFFSSDKFRLFNMPFLTEILISLKRYCCLELKF